MEADGRKSGRSFTLVYGVGGEGRCAEGRKAEGEKICWEEGATYEEVWQECVQ